MFTKMSMAALAVMAGAAMADAQEQCGPRDFVVARLVGSFAEARIDWWVAQNGLLFETWASTITGTWTITTTTPDKQTCVVDDGRDWFGINKARL